MIVPQVFREINMTKIIEAAKQGMNCVPFSPASFGQPNIHLLVIDTKHYQTRSMGSQCAWCLSCSVWVINVCCPIDMLDSKIQSAKDALIKQNNDNAEHVSESRVIQCYTVHMKFLLGWPIFRGHVGFSECNQTTLASWTSSSHMFTSCSPSFTKHNCTNTCPTHGTTVDGRNPTPADTDILPLSSN